MAGIPARPGAYVNPFSGSLVSGGRIDEGLDPTIRGPIRAVGDAVVETVTHFSGFGTYVAYRLLNGPKAGQRIFIAEAIVPHVRTGQRVKAGQVIATGTGAIETGWAGGPRGAFLPVANKAQGGSYTEGKVTAAGRDFLQFMLGLGTNPGPGGKPGGGGGVAGAAGAVAGAASDAAGAVAGAAGAVAGAPGAVAGAVGGAAEAEATRLVKAMVNVVWNAATTPKPGQAASPAVKAVVSVVLVAGGVGLLVIGINRAVGGGPGRLVKSAAGVTARATAMAAVAAPK
jgi:hypothetical protein